MPRIMSHRRIVILGIRIINTLSLLIGVAAVLSWTYFYLVVGPWCSVFHPNPLTKLGFVLLGFSLTKHLLCQCLPAYEKPIAVLYSTYMLFFVVLIFSFAVLALTIKGDGVEIRGKAYKDYKDNFFSSLGRSRRYSPYDNEEYFTSWFKKYVLKSGKKLHWLKIRQCLVDSPICISFARKYANQTESQFYENKLTPLESGCCKPPSFCHFTYRNVTHWDPPLHPGNPKICSTWKNEPSMLCYRCDSCKAAFLVNVRKEWSHVAIFYICILIFTIILHTIHCCKHSSRRWHTANI